MKYNNCYVKNDLKKLEEIFSKWHNFFENNLYLFKNLESGKLYIRPDWKKIFSFLNFLYIFYPKILLLKKIKKSFIKLEKKNNWKK